MEDIDFDLATFIPYLLNRAAEKTSNEFEVVYRSRYGMLRMEWRVLFHLGQYGSLTAKDICIKGDLHKTKVSRAVAALENKRFLEREAQPQDRRYDTLWLSSKGQQVYRELCHEALDFHNSIIKRLPANDADAVIAMLKKLISTK